jgi:hypothetical protein
MSRQNVKNSEKLSSASSMQILKIKRAVASAEALYRGVGQSEILHVLASLKFAIFDLAFIRA